MKKFLIGLLVLAVCIPLFATGGGQQGSTAGTAGRVVTQVTPRPLTVTPQYGGQEWHPRPATSYSTNPRYPQQPAVSNTNGFPIVQNSVTMKLAVVYATNILDYDDNDATRYMEELTNVRIEWDILPAVNPMERLNLMFAAADNLPDAIIGMTLPPTMLITLGSGGLIIPLEDLIEEHGHGIKMYFDQISGGHASMFAADGHIYGLSDFAPNTANQVAMRFWINRVFMDTLGMRMPTTTEEYYQYLLAVRDRDPNRNGIADEIPLLGSIDSWYSNVDGFLMNAFIINEATTSTAGIDERRRMFITEDGRIDVSYNKPEWREGLAYMNRLHSEGLLATESFTITNSELRALIEREGPPIIGSTPNGGPHNFANTAGDRRTHFEIVPPLRGPRGVQLAMYDEWLPIRSGRFVITKDSLIPEVAIKWADYCYSPDWHTRNRYGVLGRDWNIPPAGTPGVNGNDALFEELIRWGTPTNALLGSNNIAWPRFVSYNRTISPDPFELEAVLWDARAKYWPYRFPRSVPRILPFTVDEARDYNTLNRTLVEYAEQSMAQFITGQLPLNDANWNNYVQQIDRLGLPQLLRITQTAFDRTWAEALGYR